MSVENLLRVAESQYRTLLESGEWVKVKKNQSAFNSEAQSADSDGEKKKSLPPWRRPPADGEPDEKKYKGRMEYWCSKCGWNRTHKEADHKTKQELQAARNAQQLQANNQETAPAPAAAAPAPAPTPAPAPATTTAASNAAFLQTGMNG